MEPGGSWLTRELHFRHQGHLQIKTHSTPVLKMTLVSKTFIILKLSTILAFKLNINYIDSNCFEYFPF